MPWPLVVALQVVAPLSPLPAAGPPVSDRLKPRRSCPADGDSSDVIVCGRLDQERYRLRPIPDSAHQDGLPRAEANVGDAKVGVRAEDANVGGFTSHRLMLGVKLPF